MLLLGAVLIQLTAQPWRGCIQLFPLEALEQGLESPGSGGLGQHLPTLFLALAAGRVSRFHKHQQLHKQGQGKTSKSSDVRSSHAG